MNVITRFPPSPTGNLHIGGARTALFNYLFTKHTSGKIYLRLENTDEERSRPEYEKNILESLQWLGLSFDSLPDGKPFWRQSERKEIYQNYLKKLVESGKAYVSKEAPTPPQSPPRAGGEGRRSEVIRFRNPNKKVSFNDLIRGQIEFDTTELGDFIIAKSLHEPLYHLAVVVDDREMGITHVIRGEDHISNTPRQILLQEALGFPPPVYAHIPLILAPDRGKLSKRHGAVSVTEYRENEKGYLPEAFVNYLALLGWNPGTTREIFSMGELIEIFDLSKVQKGGAIFNEEKLRWFNKEYLKKVGVGALTPHIPRNLFEGRSETQVQAITQTLFDRVSTFGDIRTECEKGEFDYLMREPNYTRELLQWKWKETADTPLPHLKAAITLMEAVPEESFTASAVKNALMPYAEEKGKGDVLWPVRVALSGKKQSPDPFTLAAMLGKDTAIRRLRRASAMLQ